MTVASFTITIIIAVAIVIMIIVIIIMIVVIIENNLFFSICYSSQLPTSNQSILKRFPFAFFSIMSII